MATFLQLFGLWQIICQYDAVVCGFFLGVVVPIFLSPFSGDQSTLFKYAFIIIAKS